MFECGLCCWSMYFLPSIFCQKRKIRTIVFKPFAFGAAILVQFGKTRECWLKYLQCQCKMGAFWNCVVSPLHEFHVSIGRCLIPSSLCFFPGAACEIRFAISDWTLILNHTASSAVVLSRPIVLCSLVSRVIYVVFGCRNTNANSTNFLKRELGLLRALLPQWR